MIRGCCTTRPQAWTSDDTDAVERLKIQYGSSYCYPVSSMGSHVSAVPNHQLGRTTPLYTRANVAFFGTFGYELDLGRLSPQGAGRNKSADSFYEKIPGIAAVSALSTRLSSPFEHNEAAAWMTVSRDRRTAICGMVQNTEPGSTPSFSRLKLAGLDPDLEYEINGQTFFTGMN